MGSNVFLGFFVVLLIHCMFRKNLLILSKQEEVIVVLAGQPKDASFVSDLKEVEQDMNLFRGNGSFPNEPKKHRRGQYPLVGFIKGEQMSHISTSSPTPSTNTSNVG